MRNLFIQFIAVLLILLGLLAFPLPIPAGLPLIAIGLALLILTSAKLRRIIRHHRKQSPRFNQFVEKTERRLPGKIREAIAQTAPD